MVHGGRALSQPGTPREPPQVQCAIISFLLWILFFLVPSQGGLVDGLPLGRLETVGVALVIWIAAQRVRIAGGWIAALVAVAAAAASFAVPGERGLNARYYATATPAGAHERSTDSRDSGITRVDKQLQFTRGEYDFPLAFVNDHTRFNFMRPGEPDRRYLEFAAAWTGWWWTPAGQHTLYVRAPKGTAEVALDAVTLVKSTAVSSEITHEEELSEGWHRLQVTFSSPYGAPRNFSAGERLGDVYVPFDAASTRTEHIDDRQQFVARALAALTTAADLIALGWLSTLAALILVRRLGELWQQRVAAWLPAVSVWMAAATFEAFHFAWPWATRLRIMAAGDDTMVYEGYARDILFNGILMNGGQPLGQGEPFYYQAFYPYFLAATHAVFGESFFGALFLQRVLVAATAVFLMRIAMRLRAEAIWPVGLLLSGLFVYWKLGPISADLLSEALYVPLLAASTLALVEFSRRPVARSAIATGLLCGATAITRSTALLAWVAVWPTLFRHARRSTNSARTAALLIGCTIAMFSLIAVRNGLVSHQFAPTSTEFGITLRSGNEPPPDVPLDSAPRQALYERFRVGGYTAEVMEYAIAAPGRFAANMGRKALFVLGFYEAYAPGWGYSPVYIAVWIGALAGVIALRGSAPSNVPVMLPLVVALTQFVALVIVYPKGERLIVPIHTMLMPYAAIAVYDILKRFGLTGTPATPAIPAAPPS